MRLISIQIAWLYLVSHVYGLLDYPATVELDIVFPLNKTYNNITQMPMVFALQNAKAAYTWGWSLKWTIGRVDAKPSSWIATGGKSSMGDIPPHDTIDNIWYPAMQMYNFTKLQEGRHYLKWEWVMSTCEKIGKKTIYHVQDWQRSGEVFFSIVVDGSGKDVDLSTECPEYGSFGSATGGTTASECPFMDDEKTKHEPNPCAAKMNSVTAECVMANLTESGDKSSCKKLAGMVAEDDNGHEDAASHNVLTVLGIALQFFIFAILF